MSLRYPKPTRRTKPKKLPARQRKTPLGTLKRKADRLWSECVRARDARCIFREKIVHRSGCWGPLQADHLISRRKQALRWDLENGAALCQKHHMLVTKDNALHSVLAYYVLGLEKYKAFLERAMAPPNPLRREEVEGAIRALGGEEEKR